MKLFVKPFPGHRKTWVQNHCMLWRQWSLSA